MKAKMEKHVIRGLIATLAVAVMLGFAPQLSALVYADEGDPDMSVGTYTLAKGVNTENAQKLWYGGRAWYVIAYDGKDAAGKAITYQTPEKQTENLYPTGVVTLFQCDVVEKTRFNDTGDDWNRAGFQNYGADDQGVPSDLKTCIETNYLNGDGKTPALLNGKEVAAITSRTLPGYGYDWDEYTDPDKYDSNLINGEELKDALVWPLSDAEVSSTDGSIKNNAGDYWLRTPGHTSDEIIYIKYGTIVMSDGEIYKGEWTGREHNVRPAFYLNKKAVLFTSSAYGGKSSGKPGADALKKVGENSDNEWKVTILDSSRKFTAEFEELYSQTTVKIKYGNAVTGKDEYISAVVADKDNNIIYYGRIMQCANPDDASGSFTLDLNNKLKDGCKAYVFNEHMNGDETTDYASGLKEIIIPESVRPAQPENKAPVLEPQTFFAKDPAAALSIKNLDPDDDHACFVKSSNKKVLRVKEDVNADYGYKITPLKKGKVRVTVKCRKDGKNYTLKATYTVKAYPNVIKSLQVNGKKLKVTSKKNAYSVTQKNFKEEYATVKLSQKTKWNIDYVYVDMWNNKGEGDQIEVPVDTIKTGGKINIPAKYTHADIQINMSRKTGPFFFYQINLKR